jgi:hypothetical protein
MDFIKAIYNKQTKRENTRTEKMTTIVMIAL